MQLKFSRWLLNVSIWIRYKATYYEMKHYVKKTKRTDYVCHLKSIGYCDRNIGKSYTLVKLALKYDLPIVVRYQTDARNLKDLEYKYFKSDKIKIETICMNLDRRQCKYETLLIEEGFTEKELRKYLNNEQPLCKNIIGYINY